MIQNIKQISYTIYIVDKGEKKFVGTQEFGVNCKTQNFTLSERTPNFHFVVTWSEPLFFGRDDVLYESKFIIDDSDSDIVLNLQEVPREKLD
uniref:Uncharacterized protein n=1 Tax=Meloidogyne enterolobii TaxID=390850 RepID=A0A6V7WLD5_MELEN|nr:unnamed protein product [Meloidogyne enterolobii]